ncbi:hypothetical protein Tsubulata_005936 [Turnera subulata]|uniref:Bifunctional inhibitor/plant lipid transfer protein/seed storage helical domain-containing protein n=1 Tax=Turnera subulata TaxID=218843 RepID=A0A9Q0GA97_9ROSI|nr:hypothetical protein Tsubulata_005936 [Turnera subulata]
MMMALNDVSTEAFLLTLSLLFSTVVTALGDPGSASPSSPPPLASLSQQLQPPPSPQIMSPPPTPVLAPTPQQQPGIVITYCPHDSMKLGSCFDLMDHLMHYEMGTPPTTPCCPMFGGMLEMEAAVCLCSAIKFGLFGMDIDIPLAMTLLLNFCGHGVPQGRTQVRCLNLQAVSTEAVLLTLNLLFSTVVTAVVNLPPPPPPLAPPVLFSSPPRHAISPQQLPSPSPQIMSPPPPPTPQLPPPAEQQPGIVITFCPYDCTKLGVCFDLLNHLMHFEMGTPPVLPCCPMFGGMFQMEAAVCLCGAIKFGLFGMDIDIPLAMTLLLNFCGTGVPQGYICNY